MYREDQSGASFVLGMLTGAFIGAGVALLFAPRAGSEMRQQLGEQYRGLSERIGTTNLREAANNLREQGRERVQQLTSQLSDRMSPSGERGQANTATSPTGTTPTERFPSSAPSV